MKVLTDTHTLVWALSRPELLSKRARQALSESQVTASVANLWELALKKDRPAALVADPFEWWTRFVVRNRIPALSIRPKHVRALEHLANVHQDPFDRILVAQTLTEGVSLISKDARLKQYGIPLIW